jgi:hypothetical protein
MMPARHMQARRQFRAITSKALVNRTRMKVVNIALTKFLFVIPGCALLRAEPESSAEHCSGFRVRAKTRAPE